MILNNVEITKYKALGTKLIFESDFESILFLLEKNLGNIDSEIREGSLDIIWELIESGNLSDEVLIEIGNRMIKNLSCGIGLKTSDSVFLRSFSALILGVIISHDQIRRMQNIEPFISYEIFNLWYEEAIKYTIDEKDCRGYVEGKGWAHTISHSADLLRDFVFHSYSTTKEHLEILDILSTKLIKHGELTFFNNDDNRMTRIVIVMMLREKLEAYHYKNWLKDLIKEFEEKSWIDFSEIEEKKIEWFNTTTFLRALYFVLSFGMKNIKNIAFFQDKPLLNDEVKNMVFNTLKLIDNGLNYL